MTKLMNASKYSGLLASFYDSDHTWRNYKGQSGLLNELFRDQKSRRKVNVLDCCCGSGSHALALASSGYKVLGIDRSKELIEIAEKKAKKNLSSPRFKNKNIFSLSKDSSFVSNFNVAILMGWTVCMKPIYQRFNDLLKGIHKGLKPGGFFLFDVPLNLNIHSIPSKPIYYKLSPTLEGTLTINEKKSRNQPTHTYTYHWKIKNKLNGKGRNQEQHFIAKEVLVSLKPETVFKRLQGVSNLFRLAACLGDYQLARPYRKGDKNLILILQKNVHHH